MCMYKCIYKYAICGPQWKIRDEVDTLRDYMEGLRLTNQCSKHPVVLKMFKMLMQLSRGRKRHKGQERVQDDKPTSQRSC
jgi:hypothetical protein